MKLLPWLCTAAALLLAGCSNHSESTAATQQKTTQNDDESVTVLLKSSSPIDVNCTLIGGTMAVSRQLDGASVGACQLANGKRCSEQSLMNGSCPAG
ncbi:putative hemolysin [Pectobacterium punjabense]|uniref:putative hemolysin n=1 Tax=Pectobacterium punjabense TaxID=2108399 RepID=UPI00381A6539